MIFSKMMGKLVAVIAFIYAALHTLPLGNGFELRDLEFAVLWFVGALFLWRRKVWAAILLAILAAYDLFFEIIPGIKSLKADVRDMSTEFDLAESTIFAVSITVYSIGALMMLCVLCYGIYVLVAKWKDEHLRI